MILEEGSTAHVMISSKMCFTILLEYYVLKLYFSMCGSVNQGHQNHLRHLLLRSTYARFTELDFLGWAFFNKLHR